MVKKIRVIGVIEDESQDLKIQTRKKTKNLKGFKN